MPAKCVRQTTFQF